MAHYWVVIQNSIRNLYPANFAIVMATGIVSIAFEMMDFPSVARLLFALNLLLYLTLCAILAARVVFFLPNLVADLKTLQRAFLFLTFVVGTNIVGTQLIFFCQSTGLAILLWFVAVIGWFVCIYFLLLDFLAIQAKPSIFEIINGTTLLIVVSTVSISILGIHLLNVTGRHADYHYFVLMGLWAFGFFLYLIIIAPLIYRLFFVRFELKDWCAPYWICMGAAAIITLGGSGFVTRMPELPAWEGIREAILCMTVFIWAAGTLWIPYLLAMDARKFMRMDIATSAPLWIKIFPWSRLAFGRQHHTYETSSWSRVFPIGMYMASTLLLASATDFVSLAIISQFWGWFALLMWSLTFIGMLRSIIFAFSHSEKL